MSDAVPNDESQLFSISDGNVSCWAEQGSSVMIKSVTSYGDPVELSAEEARSLAAELLRLADRIE